MRLCTWLTLICFFGCDSSNHDSLPEAELSRGDVVRVEQVQTYTATQINQLTENIGIPYSARYDIVLYVMEYMTLNTKEQLTIASGTVAVPNPVVQQLPFFSFQHGTIVRRTSVPSEGSIEQNLIGILFSADGYLSIMPDLLGLGFSTGLHPYLIADVSASTVIDMLRAVSQWSETQSWGASTEVYLAGYSSGGYTAMAAHRAIEADYSDEFTVLASAPMAGPYDLSGTMLDLMLQETPYPQPYYLPYILLSYSETYDLYDSPSDFLASPYDITLPPLFDGTHSSADVNNAMPQIPIHIVRKDVIQAVKNNPDHPFIQRLRENDLINWVPRSPMRLYHCSADKIVPVANSQIAARELGAVTMLVDPSPQSGHTGCALISVAGARAWFNSISTAEN